MLMLVLVLVLERGVGWAQMPAVECEEPVLGPVLVLIQVLIQVQTRIQVPKQFVRTMGRW